MDFTGNGSADCAKVLPANVVRALIPSRSRAILVFMILLLGFGVKTDGAQSG
jgi:hypothetical protein